MIEIDTYLHDRDCVAYSRVSTPRQSHKRQIREIEDFAEIRNCKIVKVFKETISGATLAAERPVFLEAVKFCNENGYTLLVASIDRLARNVMFPIEFSRMEERGDFDIEIICDKAYSGHVSIECLGFSLLWNHEFVKAMLGDCDEVRALEQAFNTAHKAADGRHGDNGNDGELKGNGRLREKEIK